MMRMLVNVICVILGMVLLGLVAGGMVYMIHLGVQFAAGDLMIALLVVGFTPAVAAALVNQGADLPLLAAQVWSVALAETFIILLYQIYGFYWASIRPASSRRRVFWQRFGPAIGLTLCGDVLLILMAYGKGLQM